MDEYGNKNKFQIQAELLKQEKQTTSWSVEVPSISHMITGFCVFWETTQTT